MSRASRILFGIAALLLAGVFVLPLWRIHLIAPQYPEGLGMEIHISDVHGIQPQDLGNINELNHYIGMKTIEPNAIPELRLMPKIVVGIIVAGLLVAIAGRRILGWVWIAAFGLLGVVGMVDFYKWEYDYGHHLDFEHAIIKIPGMSYQPPLIGSKQLLNFTATSWPGPGAYIIGLSIALAVVALVFLRSSTGAKKEATARARAVGVHAKSAVQGARA